VRFRTSSHVLMRQLHSSVVTFVDLYVDRQAVQWWRVRLIWELPVSVCTGVKGNAAADMNTKLVVKGKDRSSTSTKTRNKKRPCTVYIGTCMVSVCQAQSTLTYEAEGARSCMALGRFSLTKYSRSFHNISICTIGTLKIAITRMTFIHS